jgi:hypothetical protein
MPNVASLEARLLTLEKTRHVADTPMSRRWPPPTFPSGTSSGIARPFSDVESLSNF